VLNNLNTEFTVAKVLGLLMSEERVRSRLPGHIRKQQQEGKVRVVPRQCNNCGTMHVEFRSGGKCPAHNTKCNFCERLEHYKVKCRAFKKQKSVIHDRPGVVPKNTTSDEVTTLAPL
jgi:hypothetical protein